MKGISLLSDPRQRPLNPNQANGKSPALELDKRMSRKDMDYQYVCVRPGEWRSQVQDTLFSTHAHKRLLRLIAAAQMRGLNHLC